MSREIKITKCKNCDNKIPDEHIGNTWFCSDYCAKMDACGGSEGSIVGR